MKNFQMNLKGKLQHCTEVQEKLGREVPAEHRDAVASDHEGPDANLKDTVVYIDGDGRRQVVDWRDGYKVDAGVVSRVHTPATIFVDGAEAFYRAEFYGGKTTLVATDAIPGEYAGITGEVVEVAGMPVFRAENEEGQYTAHILSTLAVKKLRRRVEDALRKGNHSLTLRTAAAAGVSLI